MKNYSKFMIVIVLFIITICVINIGLHFISIANTVANIVGVVLITSWGYSLYAIIKHLIKSHLSRKSI